MPTTFTYVYILTSLSMPGKHYTGMTDNLQQRAGCELLFSLEYRMLSVDENRSRLLALLSSDSTR